MSLDDGMSVSSAAVAPVRGSRVSGMVSPVAETSVVTCGALVLLSFGSGSL